MSGKPPKKSDMGKAWMKPRRDFRQMIAPEYHLIVTEGTETEPQYFGAMKTVIDQKYRDRIHLDITGKGDNTLSLFTRAVQDVSKSNNVYKHVWLVFDKDDFPAEQFDRTVALCDTSSTSETTFHAAWSNQCIELWFLLHFSFFQSDLHRSEYWPKLSDCLVKISGKKYRKNRPDMYEILRPYLDDAIRNAIMLEERNKGKQPSKAAPGTAVYKLLETLRPYL